MIFKLFEEMDKDMYPPLGATMNDFYPTPNSTVGLSFLNNSHLPYSIEDPLLPNKGYPLGMRLGRTLAQPVIGRPLVQPVARNEHLKLKLGSILHVPDENDCFFRAIFKSNHANPALRFQQFADAHSIHTSTENTFVQSIRTAYSPRGRTINDRYRQLLSQTLTEYSRPELIHEFLILCSTSPEYQTALGITRHNQILYFKGQPVLRIAPTKEYYDATELIHHMLTRGVVEKIINYLCNAIRPNGMFASDLEVKVLQEIMLESGITLTISRDKYMVADNSFITIFNIRNHHYMGLQ